MFEYDKLLMYKEVLTSTESISHQPIKHATKGKKQQKDREKDSLLMWPLFWIGFDYNNIYNEESK